MKNLWILFGFLLLMSGACVEKMPLPTNINAPPDFSAGDTTYLLLNPIWDESWGFQTPIEISIAPDGHIFVADSSAHQIIVLEQDGTLLEGFNGLTNLRQADGSPLSPIDVDIDKKMNIFFIDGSRNIYCWNQLWNERGIQLVSDSAIFIDTTLSDTIITSPVTSEWLQFANDKRWFIDSIFWSANQSVIDSLLSPHLFFDAGTPENDYDDFYYNSKLSLFSGLSAVEDKNYLYVTDIYHNRIIRIDFKRSYFLKLKNGETIWAHTGNFSHTVVEWGRGAGTANKPVALDVDFEGNIYYAQWGDFFSIHKIKPTLSGGYLTYPSVFQQGENDIMNLWQFSNPSDVAVDQKQFIYVANTDAQEIQVFNSDGGFFKKAGITEMTVDTTIWTFDGTDSVAVDTFITLEIKGFLSSPRAVTVDNRDIIYICDTPNSRVVRYRLSNTLDENVTVEK